MPTRTLRTTHVIIKVRGLKKYFELKKGFFSFGKEPIMIKAVDDVNFDIRSGEVIGLVGESGCGKTTVGRLLTRLEDPTEGFVFFLGRDIALLEGQDIKVFRRNIQMVFQDPYESLNPRNAVLQTVMEPLVNHNIGDTLEDRVEMVIQALEDAGLAPAKEYLERFPHELSGGQRQRVSIARALVIKPKVIVADEPVSMLDVSIRAGVLNLMLDLRDKYGIPYLFITHDIAVARYVSDRLAVMYLGRVVEIGETDRIILSPKHPYTQALISAVPVPDPDAKHGRIKIKGEVPSAANIPLGCRFRPRCPQAFEDCGWQGEDLVEWLEENGLLGSDSVLTAEVRKLHPDEFVLGFHLKEGKDSEKVLRFIRERTSQASGTNPMFRAIERIDKTLTDRIIEIRCKSAELSASDLAAELFTELESIVRHKEIDHPMHDIITGMRRENNKLTVDVGGGTAENLNTIEAFLKDFVKHYRKMSRPEFKGVKTISPSSSGKTVTATCNDSKEPAYKVAKDVSALITNAYVKEDMDGLGGLLLPIKVKGSRITVRIMGSDENWKKLESSLKSFLRARSESGEHRCAAAVSDISIKSTKAKQSAIVVKFRTVAEPPQFDVGEQQVACYLYKDSAV
ncbi:MAG: ABC transporter ATP-binding protein [Thermoplasmata archaeon]|nr:ABC transporter ATP-binding protein [Thermoplasmata archaeon]